MAIPRAAPSGIFGSGYQPAAPNVMDIGSVIDAAVNGASSLLQGAYLRKVAERNAQIADQTRKEVVAQRNLENRRADEAVTYKKQQDTQAKAERDRQHELDKEKVRQAALEKGIRPAGEIPAGIVAPTPTKVPERYDPNQDRDLQRQLRVRATPTPDRRTPAEIPGNPAYNERVKTEAEIRARAAAKFRQPATDQERSSQRIAIRRAVQESRTAHLKGTTFDRRGNPIDALSPVDAHRQAIEDASEIWGEEAVADAVGNMIAPPAPTMGTSFTPSTGGAPVRLKTPQSAAQPAAPATAQPTAAAPAAPAPRPAPVSADTAAMSAWVRSNPPVPGETREAYRARFEARKKAATSRVR